MENKKIKLPKKLAAFLESSGVKFESVGHRTVFTALDKAATLKVKPGTIAKVLTLKIDNGLALAVIGGDRNLDIDKLQKLAKAKRIDFAKEKLIGETFKGIDPGAIPAFAGLWKIPVFCDKRLLECPKIIFSAGAYECSVKMAPGAFKKANSEMIVGVFSKTREKKAKTAPKPKSKSVKPRKTAGKIKAGTGKKKK